MSHPTTRKHVIYSALIVLSLAGIGIATFFDLYSFSSPVLSELAEGVHIRILGSLVFVLLMALMGYSLLVYRKVSWRLFGFVVVPGILIAINNLPIVAALNGRAVITQDWNVILVFIVFCFAIGLFEEVVFRGLILTVLLQRLPQTKTGILQAIVLSSLVFGVLHFVNFVAGANPFDTLLQIGYSFLMGMLWAVVYLKTKNLWMAIVLHALYNISGLLYVTTGSVYGRYDVLTVIVTVLIGVIGVLYYFWIYQTIDPDDIKELYEP
jgi:membrane protease YdiL (CAAX protease family)